MENNRRSYNFIDLTGRRFYRLLVTDKFECVKYLDKNGITKTRAYWDCICECGKTTKVSSSRLRTGKTRSCGCLRFDNKSPQERILSNNDATKNSLYYRYNKSALTRKINFDLTMDQFLDIVFRDCYYCGKEPSNCEKCRNSKYSDLYYNGIDRVDNTKGYEPDNCVPCCKICNRAKDTMTEQEFLEWVSRIHKHRKL